MSAYHGQRRFIGLCLRGVALAAAVVCTAMAAVTYAADPVPAVKPAPEADRSLDDALLKQLGEGVDSDLLEGLEQPPAQKSKRDQPAPDQAPPRAGSDDLEERLRQELGGAALPDETDNPLVRAGQRMRAAQERIAAARADTATQELQTEAVAAIDELLEQAKKKRGQKSSGKQPQQQSKRSQPQQPQRQQQQAGASGSGNPQQASRDSTEELRPDRVEAVDAVLAGELMKDLWGHLPARVKEQMLQSSIEEFLPKYQALIEEYFKRLIDEQSRNPR